MSDYIEMVLRAILAIIALFACTKVMGRRELAEMSMFDYILGISIGAIGAELAINIEEPFYDYLIVMAIFVGIHQLITLSTLKSLWARKFFEGSPIVIMEEGKISERNLKRVHYDINTFLEECRLKGYFDLAEIQTAIMESTGTLSFIPKAKKGEEQKHLVANLVVDGKIIEINLKSIKKDEEWLRAKISKENRKLEEILLATYNEKDEFRLYLYKENVDIKHVLE